MRATPTWGRLATIAMVFGAVVIVAILLRRPYAFLDLAVYDWGAHEAFTPSLLYDVAQPGTGLRFTYTPFAAIAFRLLDAVHLLGPGAFTAVAVVCLLRSCWLLAAHRGALLPSWSRSWMTVALASGTVIMEPGGGTLLLGQVNFLLLWLVVEGMLGPLRTRALGGVGVGLATAIKLTPGIYLVLLAITGRWRQLLVSAATVAATIALGWLLLPADTVAFWRGTGADADRVGALEFISNQSINGVLWRALGPGGSTAGWIVLALTLGAVCLLLARRYADAGEHAVAVGLAGLAGLLASPVSWTHHWVVVLPLVVGLLGTVRRRALLVASTLGTCVVFGSRAVWHVPQGAGLEFDHAPLQQLMASSYVICALVLLGAAWAARPVRPRRGDVRGTAAG